MMDIAALALGVMDEMGGNLTQLGSDVLEKRQTETANELNFALWNIQNAYNDPSAQMQRLRNAGLNPNLVYGKGATTVAPQPPAAQKSNASGKMDFNSLNTYLSTLQAQVVPYQVDLVKQQTKNQILQEKILGEKFKQEIDNTYILNRSREGQAVGKEYAGHDKHTQWYKNLTNAAEEIKQSSIKTKIMELQQQLLSGQIDQQTFDIELNKLGLTKNDPTVYRVFKTFFESLINQ